jgi:hypothetical protein
LSRLRFFFFLLPPPSLPLPPPSWTTGRGDGKVSGEAAGGGHGGSPRSTVPSRAAADAAKGGAAHARTHLVVPVLLMPPRKLLHSPPALLGRVGAPTNRGGRLEGRVVPQGTRQALVLGSLVPEQLLQSAVALMQPRLIDQATLQAALGWGGEELSPLLPNTAPTRVLGCPRAKGLTSSTSQRSSRLSMAAVGARPGQRGGRVLLLLLLVVPELCWPL